MSHSALLLSSRPVMPRHSCPSPSPRVWPSSCPLHQYCHPAISSPDAFFSFCPQSFPASGTFPMSLHQMTKILELQLQYQSSQWVYRVDFPEDWLVWSPCCPMDFQESSPDHSSKALILHHSAFFMVQFSQPYMRENHSLEYMDLCQQSNVSAFQYTA